jgi:outer membrane protein assembly factor BamE (lipoprotein component of BamABCDE complex)
MKKIINTTKIMILSIIFAAISGCVKNVQVIGYSPEREKFDKLEAGKTNKDSVKAELGSPSAVSTYGIETWYYISTVQESVAFLKPEVTAQKVVAIEFDSDQIVQSVRRFDESDAQEIKISKEVTTSKGHDDGVIRQILGNVGRFNTNRNDAAAPSN